MALDPGALLGPYEIEVLLGMGSMGEIYRARDIRLERPVAIKILPKEVSANPERRNRFDREARAIASLSHPHICALFDIGDHGGTPYLVMEHLAGITLADRLEKGAIPLDEVLKLAPQVARALAAAHSRGIIHRDLKPANIMLTSEGMKVLDFGLAKFLEPEGVPPGLPESTSVLDTAPHVILGTAAYMSPEQARGKLLDHRTDIWSFGAVLFEMLSGKRLIEGETIADVIGAVLHKTMAWSELPRNTPKSVNDLLRGLLERDAKSRTEDLSEVIRQLESEALSVTHVGTAPVLPENAVENSIVVLPFTNISSDPDNEYFSDGLTEEVIADLSKVGALRVISRTTAMRLKGHEKDLKDIANELDIRFALEGSVRKMGNNLRITVQLIDAQTDAQLWSDKYSGNLDDVFKIQEEVSRAIVESLRVTLTPEEEQKLSVSHAPNGYAYDVYLRARRDIIGFTKEGIDRGREELERALSVVGDDVLLYKGLGMAYWQYVNAGVTADQGHLDKAEAYAQKILALQPESPHGMALLGFIAVQRGDIASWVRHFTEAYRVDPNDPDHGTWLGMGWTMAGFPDKARPILEQQLSVDPYSAWVLFGLGLLDYFDIQYDDAIDRYEKSWRLMPENPAWPMMIAQALVSMGNIEGMKAFVEEKTPPPESHPLANLNHILKCAALGDGEAVDRLDSEEFQAVIWGDLMYTYIFAQALSLLGREDAALRWLERSFERGNIIYPFISGVDPLLENLRDAPRFDDLMKRMRTRWQGFEAEVSQKD